MKLLDDYLALEKSIHAHFGYVESWQVIPLDDGRSHYWYINQERVYFADTEEELQRNGDTCYEEGILPEKVYRTAEYTMIGVDTQTDGNLFLRIYDNKKERNPNTLNCS